ncbi:MAG TPA: ankyrin repeat domain-containing protein, partial [Spirochaetota bacterium]|nr:ankyrin repeat domain-containing protein [Spirochaetota bacterium]
IVKLLIDRGARVDVPESDGTYPIHRAKKKETLLLLLSKGAKINTKTPNKWNLLHFLASTSSSGVSDDYAKSIIETAELALKQGIDINAQAQYIHGGAFFVGTEYFYNATPLLTAVINNNPDMVKLLLEHGADQNIKDSRKKKPIDYAQEIPEILALFQ